jgi:hypothetical protein
MPCSQYEGYQHTPQPGQDRTEPAYYKAQDCHSPEVKERSDVKMLKRVTTESVGNDSGVSLNPREHHGKWSDECIAKTSGRSANEENSVTEHRLGKTVVQYIYSGQLGRAVQ